jgi:15-cis-phytoene synthase
MGDQDINSRAVDDVSAVASRDAGAQCAILLREQDPDRYFASLFAPAQHRDGLFALYTFSGEIARVRETVRDPLPGEVRMQWWRDVLSGDARGDVQSHPVAAALLNAVSRYNLPISALFDLIDARTFDLYDDPMPTLADLEGYSGETSSILIRLACLILADGKDSGGATAAGHAGVAYAVTGLMRALPWHSRRGQVYLPSEILSRYGVTRDDIVCGRGGPGLHRALAEMRAIARHHLQRARASFDGAPDAVRAAFMPLALVEPYLKRMERRGYDPLNDMINLPMWRRQFALYYASLRRF